MIFLLLLLFADQKQFQTAHTDVSNWSQTTSWQSADTDDLPGESDRVLIPGRSNKVGSIAIQPDVQVRAATVMVGTTRGGSGSLSIAGQLQVNGPVEGEAEAGRFYVGRNQGTGAVQQEPGSSVQVSKTVRIGYNKVGDGTYLLNDASLKARGVLVGIGTETTGTLDIYGASKVDTGVLTFGKGKGRLLLTPTGSIPEVEVHQRSILRGTLKVDLSQVAERHDEIILVRNNGTTKGGFRRVLVGDALRAYELDYFGGDGNDLSLRAVSARHSTFESWRAEHLDESALPFADNDNDSVPNVGEYKLGCCPKTDEGPLRVQTDSAGLPYIRYTERTDREDVLAIPQGSYDGSIWSSDLIERRTVSRFGKTRTVRVTATKPDVRLRVVFEMQPEPTADKNLLFVVIDDLNDWVEGFGGHSQTVTPNLARLASRGIRFTQAHANATLCNPSRVSLLTGRLPSSTGIYDNDGALRKSPVLRFQRTIPENFQFSGYRMLGGGKLFHKNPKLQTWDEYFPNTSRNRPGDPLPDGVPLSGITTSHGRFDWGPVDVDDSRMSDVKVTSWAAGKLLEPVGRRPFFLGCGIFRPHLPFYVPPKYFEPWAVEDIQLPTINARDMEDLPEPAITRLTKFTDHQSVLEKNQWKQAVHGYLASVHFADAQLGRVLDALESGPHVRNTVVVALSDHGWQFGEKTAWRKNTLWDRATRVPLIIWAPGVTTPGTECDECVSLVDVYPTVNELCDLKEVVNLDGESLVPFIRNPNRKWNRPSLSTQFFKEHALRTEQWRYIRYSTGDEELYDHSNDPHEWNNLAQDSDYDDIKDKLRKWLPKTDHEYVGEWNDSDIR